MTRPADDADGVLVWNGLVVAAARARVSAARPGAATVVSMEWPGDGDGRIDDRERRVIKNEALFRQVNERIEEVSELVPEGDLLEFLCECGEESCLERIELTRAEYEAVRGVPTHFAITPGHAHEDFERVVDHRERYDVIEKQAESAPVARRTDPRT